MQDQLTAELLLDAYRRGVFPMSEARDDPDVFWVNPVRRGIFPLGHFHISRSLKRIILKEDYTVTVSQAFPDVVRACAERPETWINETIFELYCDLAKKQHAHSVEIWSDGQLIGGVYGVIIGAAFFGESMFSRKKNASKIALAYLHHRLLHTGFLLFDTQFLTRHLASLGAIEISRAGYRFKLQHALESRADFLSPDYSVSTLSVTQDNGQTS